MVRGSYGFCARAAHALPATERPRRGLPPLTLDSGAPRVCHTRPPHGVGPSMPKLSLAAAAALALLFARGAQAEADLYLALDGGLSFAHDADVSDNNGPNNADLRYAHGDDFRHLGWNA